MDTVKEKKDLPDEEENVREQIKETAKSIGLELEERDGEEILDCHSVMAMVHLIRCAVDVARQYEEIDNVDDLIIHPIGTMLGSDERPKLLLRHVSDALRLVIKQLDVSLGINTRGGSVYDPEYQNDPEYKSE